MGEAETQLGKPILLEEFGKRLVKGADAQLFAEAIDQLRNPVFQTTYSVVAAAIQACAPHPCLPPVTLPCGRFCWCGSGRHLARVPGAGD